MNLLEILQRAVKECVGETGEEPRAWLIHPLAKPRILVAMEPLYKAPVKPDSIDTLMGIPIEWKRIGSRIAYRDRFGDVHVVVEIFK